MIEALLAIIGILSAATMGLILFVFKSIDKRIGGNTDRITCLEKKMIKIATLIGLANRKEIFDSHSPLTIKKNETVTEVIERYMKEGDG